MGTNASTKKVASKIVAVLLAALMLISVMPMTAFAAPVEGKPVVIDGFTLTGEPADTTYYVGNYVNLAGLELEITYIYEEDIEKFGDDAKLRKEVITYSDLASFIDALDDFGVKCNYSDYVKGSKADKTLTMNNNVENLKFFYGENGTKVWETNVYFNVFPKAWDAAEKVNLYNNGEYIVVVNGEYVLTTDTVDTTVISGALSENALAVEKFNIDNAAGVITNLTEQLKGKKETTEKDGKVSVDYLTESEILWDVTFAMDAAGNYSVEIANDGNKVTDKEIAQNAINKSEWALVADAAGTTDWMFNNDGTICVAKTEMLEDAEGKKQESKTIYYYVTLADGYLKLVADASKAAKIDLYQIVENVNRQVKMIEIAKDADKLSYVEGEYFNADGMVVNVSYTDGTVICVPAVLFDVYGIKVDKGVLALSDNDQYYTVSLGSVKDTSNKTLKVEALELKNFVLTDGELTTGLYAIVWSPEGDDYNKGNLMANTTYNGVALTTVVDAYNRLEKTNTDYTVTTLTGADVTFRNNALGNVNDKGNNFVNGEITMVWQITAANNKYTISVPGTDLYLNRVSVADKYDNWALEGNNVAFKAKEDKVLVLGDLCADSYWDIDGTVDAAIESFTTLSTETNYYITLDDAYNVFYAKKDTNDKATENFYFFKTESAVTATKIEIVDQANANYASGDVLDLGDLVVKVTYSNGTWVEVAYDDFNSYGIKVNYADGAVLGGADNGKNIVVSLGNLTSTGAALNVTDSKADAEVIRVAGADRYATAAAIADSYVAALGADYANVAVLASGVNYPDALAGATLAAALKAPIVLTKTDALVSATESFLKDNAVKTVYVLGGTSAINADVEAALKALNINVIRISGADRVETSIAVAQQLATVKGYADTVVLTNGANFADALSVSSAAAAKGLPVIYVNGTLTDNVKSFITTSGATKAVILGGEAAVSADVEAAVKAMGLTVDRVKGADRWETSVAIAEYFADSYTGKAVAFATGKDFPDALAGGVYASYVGAPVVLLDNGYANADAALYTAGLELTNVYVFGGVEALSDATIDAALLK